MSSAEFACFFGDGSALGGSSPEGPPTERPKSAALCHSSVARRRAMMASAVAADACGGAPRRVSHALVDEGVRGARWLASLVTAWPPGQNLPAHDLRNSHHEAGVDPGGLATVRARSTVRRRGSHESRN